MILGCYSALWCYMVNMLYRCFSCIFAVRSPLYFFYSHVKLFPESVKTSNNCLASDIPSSSNGFVFIAIANISLFAPRVPAPQPPTASRTYPSTRGALQTARLANGAVGHAMCVPAFLFALPPPLPPPPGNRDLFAAIDKKMITKWPTVFQKI